MNSAMRTALFRASAVALLVIAAGSPTVLFAKSAGAKTHAAIVHAHGKKAGGKHVHVAKAQLAGFQARDAFYSGDYAKAYELAPAAGERWIAGLASYRMHSYVEAFQYFQAVAQDEAADAWTRSGAAYWAARSAVDAGLTSVETPLLRQAASYPWTFYGMIAERQLGLEPMATFAQTVTSPEVRLARAKNAAAAQPIESAIGGAEGVELIKVDDVTAKADDAGTREFAAVAATPDAAAAAYPVPDLAPTDGFTVDPALVYAIIRQESRFTPEARSRVGAVGLMQVMPETAVLTTGEARYRRDRAALREPANNMRIGQAYLNLLTTAKVGDDLLMVIAAYNGGPGAAQKARERGGNDPLMQIETLPAKETREYVERVMAGYWLYRRQFGESTPSLDALAAGARISVSYDKTSNPAARVQQAKVSLPNSVTRTAPTDAAATVAALTTF